MKTRKLSGKVKILMFVFAGLVVGLCGVFGFAVFKTIGNQDESIVVSSDCVVYDVSGNAIILDDSATIYKTWNGIWVLKDMNKNTYTLGQNAVVYDQNVLKVFGGGYQIVSDSEVQVLDEYIEFSSLSDAGFFKLNDRNYLAIGTNIGQEGEPVSTTGYLNMLLDKSGNALLLNNEVCEKTKEASAITVDNTYNFDIANEKLKLGDVIVDVGAIMGTTNEYDEETDPQYLRDKVEERLATGDDTTNPDEIVIDAHGGKGGEGGVGGTGGTGANGGQGGAGGAGGPGGEGGTGVAPTVTDARKTMNIYEVTPSYTQATVVYNVNDPYGQLGDVYFLITDENDSTATPKNITCDIDGNRMTFFGLTPDRKYKLELFASTDKEKPGATQYFTTLSPSATISVTSINEEKIVCRVYYESGMAFSSANLCLYDGNDSVSTKQSINTTQASSSGGAEITFLYNLPQGKNKTLKVGFSDVKVIINNTETNTNVSTVQYFTNPYLGLYYWRDFISKHGSFVGEDGRSIYYDTGKTPETNVENTTANKTKVTSALSTYKDYKSKAGFTDWDVNGVGDALESIRAKYNW